jgi:hypothetical protein
MIRPEELRCGSIVEYNGMFKTISSIDNRGYVTFVCDPVMIGNCIYAKSPSIHLSFFKPIELTEELLIKCGFVDIYRSSFRIKFEHPEYVELGYHINFTKSYMTLTRSTKMQF